MTDALTPGQYIIVDGPSESGFIRRSTVEFRVEVLGLIMVQLNSIGARTGRTRFFEGTIGQGATLRQVEVDFNTQTKQGVIRIINS